MSKQREHVFRLIVKEGSEDDILLSWLKDESRGKRTIIDTLKIHWLVDAYLDLETLDPDEAISPETLQKIARRAVLQLRNQIDHIGTMTELPEATVGVQQVFGTAPDARPSTSQSIEPVEPQSPKPFKASGYDSDMGF